MDSVETAYRRMADRYIELFAGTTHVHSDDLAFISRHLSIRPGRVLDVGCGPGHLTEHLRLLGIDAIGIDLVPEFIDHARMTYPDGRYEIGSMRQLDVPDCSVAGMLVWYSLIHLPPAELDEVLAELRRPLVAGSTIVVGFFDGTDLAEFDHAVTTAYYWPVEEMSARLDRAGFSEIERGQRSGINEARRPHAVIAATAR
jgi:SAM-dependent methyltransferase